MSAVQIFWKMWKMDKLLIVSNSFFSNCIFYFFRKLSTSFVKPKIVISISESLEESKICCFRNG